jgi:hypothetical protein
MTRRLILYTDQREMPRAQFKAALKKHGFTQHWLWFVDNQSDGRTHHGGLIHPKTKKLWRRATLAYLLNERENRANATE